VCFATDSAPPIPPVSGASIAHERVVLEAPDGNRLLAFSTTPEEPSGKGVVVLPDVRGLYRFYEELALRFAEHGFSAVAIDYFGRTAGTGERGEDFDFMAHVDQTTPEGVQQDVVAGLHHLRSPAGGSCRSVFTLGFCFGGSQSWLFAAADHSIAGAIGFYGRPVVGRDGSPGPAARASDIASPILALMGGDDPSIPEADVEEFRQALASAGVEHEIVVYPGAPHSFFDRKQEEFVAESEDAWRRVLAFLERYG
jgi:carboxymethylenebutenolidase